jgi:hypothetical protein
VLVPLGSEELLAAGEELDTEDLGRLGYTATSAELRTLLEKVVEAKREAIARAVAEQAAAAGGGQQQAAAGKGGGDSEVNSSRLRKPVLRRNAALHGQQAADGAAAAAAAGSRGSPS